MFYRLIDLNVNHIVDFHCREWFRASLILIPLLASHYIVLLAMSLLANFLPPRVEIVWFYIDQLFTSFQVTNCAANETLLKRSRSRIQYSDYQLIRI